VHLLLLSLISIRIFPLHIPGEWILNMDGSKMSGRSNNWYPLGQMET